MRYVQDTRRIFVHFFRFLRYGIAYGELMINANQMWLIIWTVTLSLAVGQEFRFAEELKAAVITMIIDALVVQQLMAIQQMLELELLVALVTDVDTAILLMQMIIEKYSARKKQVNNQVNKLIPLSSLAGEDISAFVTIEPAHFPVMHIVMLH